MRSADSAEIMIVPPAPASRALLGMAATARRDRIGMMTKLARDFGDAMRFRLGSRYMYFFNHPSHVRHVLCDNATNYRKGIGLIQARRVLGEGMLTSDGAVWAHQRRAVGPTLHRKLMLRTTAAITAAASAMVERWRADRGPRDVLSELTDLTLDILEHALLHVQLVRRTELAAAFATVQDQAMFELTTLGAIPLWLPTARNFRYRRARRVLDVVLDDLIGQWVRGPRRDEDLATRLLDAHPGGRSDHGLRDQIVTLLLAGHETTASALSWTLHELSQHPEVAEQVYDEARAVLPDALDASVGEAEVRALVYTTQVVHETLRLHPPVWLLPRRAIKPDRVGDYFVAADADVIICPYTLHRHPALWPQPDEFRPDRFAHTDRDARQGYLPFGAGPRVCVGSHLGMLETVLVTASVARRVKLHPMPGHEVRPAPMLTLKPDGGLPLIVTPRPAPA